MGIVARATTDKPLLRSFLERDRLYAAYAICDLEEREFSRTRWGVAWDGDAPIAVVLEYNGPTPQPLFAMGREGVLPAAFARTHPRFKTPVNATIAVTVVATVMALLIGYPLSDPTFGQPFSNYYFWATVGTLIIIIVYVMLCIGGIVFFRKTRDSRKWNPLVHVVIPVVGDVVRLTLAYNPDAARVRSPDAARHPQVDTVRGGGVAAHRDRRAAVAARAAARVGGQDRLHPR